MIEGFATRLPAANSVVSDRGFTLVEILVVLFVVGLAAGLAYARLEADPRQTLANEARLFGAALEHAALLAQWRSETVGVSAEGPGYRFWRRAVDDRWVPIADDDLLRYRALPAGIAILPRDYAGQALAAGAIVPFRASGRNEPVRFDLVTQEWRIDLLSDPLNRVAFTGPVPR